MIEYFTWNNCLLTISPLCTLVSKQFFQLEYCLAPWSVYQFEYGPCMWCSEGCFPGRGLGEEKQVERRGRVIFEREKYFLKNSKSDKQLHVNISIDDLNLEPAGSWNVWPCIRIWYGILIQELFVTMYFDTKSKWKIASTKYFNVMSVSGKLKADITRRKPYINDLVDVSSLFVNNHMALLCVQIQVY